MENQITLPDVAIKNPTEYDSVKRTNETLSFQNNVSLLTPNDYGEYVTPMAILDDKYSKWKLNYANSKTGEGGDYSIDIRMVAHLDSMTQACNNILAQIAMGQSKSEIPDEMKEVINFLPREMSEGKGLTAIQLAKQYSYDLCNKAVQGLIDQGKKPGNKYAQKNMSQANILRYATLCVNAQKYKIGNKSLAEIMNLPKDEMIASLQQNRDASLTAFIKDLVTFIQSNADQGRDVRKSLLLDLGSCEAGGSFVLLDQFKTPNNKKVIEDRKSPLYGLTKGVACKIVCHFGAEYPYHVTIESMYGKPLEGQVGMSRKDAKNYKSFTFQMLGHEWTHAVMKENALVQGLYYTEARRACQIAAYYNQKNRESWQVQGAK